jgi:hypothetical protein
MQWNCSAFQQFSRLKHIWFILLSQGATYRSFTWVGRVMCRGMYSRRLAHHGVDRDEGDVHQSCSVCTRHLTKLISRVDGRWSILAMTPEDGICVIKPCSRCSDTYICVISICRSADAFVVSRWWHHFLVSRCSIYIPSSMIFCCKFGCWDDFKAWNFCNARSLL